MWVEVTEACKVYMDGTPHELEVGQIVKGTAAAYLLLHGAPVRPLDEPMPAFEPNASAEDAAELEPEPDIAGESDDAPEAKPAKAAKPRQPARSRKKEES